ncbi:MAG: hypothetical protein R3A47_02965 [Polyangiales bacterium]
MTTGRLPFRSADREELLEMQRTKPAPSARKYRSDLPEAADRIILKLLQKDPEDRFRDGHHLKEELKALQRQLPAQSFEPSTETVASPPPPPPKADVPGVVEWSRTAANFLRAVARAYPNGRTPEEVKGAADQIWELASRAATLEGELETHSKRLEAIEKRGRGLRAEIGRKVEELAGEESRALREASAERERLKTTIMKQSQLDKQRMAMRATINANSTARDHQELGAIEGRIELLSDVAADHESRAVDRESHASKLREQIVSLRAQLKRYSEALENDLQVGRDRIATRVREALNYEQAFQDASEVLVQNLQDKPECAELIENIMSRKKRRALTETPSELQEIMEAHRA